MLVHPGNMPRTDQKFDAMIVWMSEYPLVPGKQHAINIRAKRFQGRSTLRYRVDVNTLRRQDSPTLKPNEIGRCYLTLNRRLCTTAIVEIDPAGIHPDGSASTPPCCWCDSDRVTTDEKPGIGMMRRPVNTYILHGRCHPRGTYCSLQAASVGHFAHRIDPFR